MEFLSPSPSSEDIPRAHTVAIKLHMVIGPIDLAYRLPTGRSGTEPARQHPVFPTKKGAFSKKVKRVREILGFSGRRNNAMLVKASSAGRALSASPVRAFSSYHEERAEDSTAHLARLALPRVRVREQVADQTHHAAGQGSGRWQDRIRWKEIQQQGEGRTGREIGRRTRGQLKISLASCGLSRPHHPELGFQIGRRGWLCGFTRICG